MPVTYPSPLRVVGVPGSPYSRKLLAALRYRRLPHVWIVKNGPEDRGLPSPKVELLPQLLGEDDQGRAVAITDTTPVLRDLDARFEDRRLRPGDPVVALFDALVEDWADEWLTKPMFHYRWHYRGDADHAAAILPRWGLTQAPDTRIGPLSAVFAERQIGRLGVVGSSDTTAPVIEDSYRRALALLSARLEDSRFLLGDRPAAADFAAYGQLTQLVAFDPTPAALAFDVAPRVVAWVDVVDDLSGLEPSDDDWVRRDAVPATLRALLAEIGRIYVPYLLANEQAVARGAAAVDCELDGRRWTQQPFRYQARCAAWLREEYAALSQADRQAADDVLAGTGCEALFASTGA